MNKSESEILEILNGLGSKKLDLDILFSFYSLELSYEIRKIIAEKIGMQEREGYFFYSTTYWKMPWSDKNTNSNTIISV